MPTRTDQPAQVSGLLAEYLGNIPNLHSWDAGATWNTGGFDSSHFAPLAELISRSVPAGANFIETGAGNSTIFFLLQNPSRVVSIAPDAALFERIHAYCAGRIWEGPLEKHVEGSQWVLPRLAAASGPSFDFALVDGCHGWPMVFVDFQYLNYLLRPGGYIMIDDTHLHSVSELVALLREQPGYEVALDLGKAIVFGKRTHDRELPGWGAQPYIARRTDEHARAQAVPVGAGQ